MTTPFSLLYATEESSTHPPPTETVELETVSEEALIDTETHSPQVGALTLRNILHHPDAHPITLDIMYLRQYGPEWMLWEGETLQHLAPSDFHQTLSDMNLAKLQAVRTLHLVDTFWKQWEIFGWCTLALNGVPPDFQTMQAPLVSQAAIAVDIANRIRPDEVPWSEEIRHYLAAVFRHDSVYCPQPPLDFVTLDVEGTPLDIPEISKRWPGVRASGHAPTGETVTDEQLRRMLLVDQHLEESRTHLRDQLHMVHHGH